MLEPNDASNAEIWRGSIEDSINEQDHLQRGSEINTAHVVGSGHKVSINSQSDSEIDTASVGE